MISNFIPSVNFTLSQEGGYQDNPADPGNWTGGKVGHGVMKGTKYGISAESYPHLDIKNLTVVEAEKGRRHREISEHNSKSSRQG